MHVLMISLEDEIVAKPEGDARRRHERYAESAGHLTVIAYSRRAGGQGGSMSPHLTAFLCGGPRALFPLRAVWTGLRQARRPVDLVTSQDPFITGLAGLILARLLGAPLLVQNHSAFFDNPYWIAEHPLRNRLFNALGKAVIRRATMHRVVNEAERAKYLAAGIPPERVHVIPLANPAPFAVAIPPQEVAAQRAAWGLDEAHHVVLWVGWPVANKRVPLLLEAMRRVAEADPLARLVLVGDLGRSLDDLLALIAHLGLDGVVIAPGPSAHVDLPRIYRAADVYAMTSVYEGLPRVLSEAGASGLPQVVMDAPGVREAIVDGENGYIVPFGDVDAFAARLLELLGDPNQRAAMGQAAQAYTLTHFDPDRLFQAWMDCWKEAVSFQQSAFSKPNRAS
jgi:glycosyltransferase involved in cell wall biosynthesis